MTINANRTGWVVVREGRIASAHRTQGAASLAAGRDGAVQAIEAGAPAMSLGDRVAGFAGQVIPR